MAVKAITALLVAAVAAISVAVSGVDTEKGQGARVIPYTEAFTVVAEYPHDNARFTQGLFFYGGEMYESTGRYGESRVYKNIDVKSGTAERTATLDDTLFGEGSVILDGRLYVLTYKENTVLVMNPDTLEIEKTLPYNRQGWGLTTDGEYLIASDGSDKLFFMDKELRDIKSVTVTFNGEPVKNINELEYVDGVILANIWLTDSIAVIDPSSGATLAMLDFSGLYDGKSTDINDVLNGIAYDPESGKLYLTGKRWDTLFELEYTEN